METRKKRRVKNISLYGEKGEKVYKEILNVASILQIKNKRRYSVPEVIEFLVEMFRKCTEGK
ncbi:MAG: hypothetical protein ACP5MH_10310 [Thermoproteus sp.]